MTPKQEAFARAYVETGNASEAYRQAYDAENMKEDTIWKRASELLQHGEVAGRIGSIQQAAQKRTEITVEKLTQMAMEAYEASKIKGNATGQMQTAAMVKASEFLGKLHGLIVEKREIKNVSSAEDLDDSELADLAMAGRRGTAKASGSTSQSH
jgi:phage terminase small subunit